MDSLTARWLQRLGEEIAWGYAARLALALAAVLGLALGGWHADAMVPLLLGVFASALAETDDSWRGRLKALAVSLACFAAVALAVVHLAAQPWALLATLLGCSFLFTLLGAVGGRYRAIAASTIILALYAAMTEHAPAAAALSPDQVAALLLAGAAWYGLLSVGWSAAAPLLPVRHALAGLYVTLGAHLRLKAAMFEPVRGVDMRQRRLDLAWSNARLVTALEAAKQSLLACSVPGKPPAPALASLLQQYFAAQDIHERASASHYPYADWTEVLFHSDVLYRCQRVLLLQGDACLRMAQALRRRRWVPPLSPEHPQHQALADLHASLAWLEGQGQAAWREPLRPLRAVARNLARLAEQLGAAAAPTGQVPRGDIALLDRAPQSLREGWLRVRAQLRVRSALFRHAVRLSLALAAAWTAMRWTEPRHGYWIMMATLIVCQPTYGATLSRLSQRIGGTVLGLLLGWALMRLFPQPPVQAVLAMAGGVVFFVTRTRRYVLATGAVTLMVLMLFNHGTGSGFGLIVPRLLDTVVGAAIAAVALLLVLPDWQGRRLGAAAADALQASAAYLRRSVAQYATGRSDDLAYRVARREAHSADAALSATVAHMLREPPWVRRHARAALDLLASTHTLLGYLSALGAHRDLAEPGERQAPAADGAAAQAAEALGAQLEAVAHALRKRQVPPPQPPEAAAWAQRLEQGAAGDTARSLLSAQLVQVTQQVEAVRRSAAALSGASRSTPG